jgi:AcrR family transcriptional regulator
VTSGAIGTEPVQQRGWETRRRILDAAITCLVRYGYGRTTVQRVLDEAKVSRGSLLYQFPSRDRLLVVAVQQLAAYHTANLAASGEKSAGAQPPDPINAAVEAMWRTMQTPLFAASLELWIAARTNAGLRAVLEPEEMQLGRIIRDTLAELFGRDLASRPRFGELRSLLLSSMRGVALTYTFTPDRDPSRDPHVEIWKTLAHEYLDPRQNAGAAG